MNTSHRGCPPDFLSFPVPFKTADPCEGRAVIGAMGLPKALRASLCGNGPTDFFGFSPKSPIRLYPAKFGSGCSPIIFTLFDFVLSTVFESDALALVCAGAPADPETETGAEAEAGAVTTAGEATPISAAGFLACS
ncbi:MAG: hypothetical protein IPM93_14465 [Candidatus Obscuribacter sp.]|nr:hypothetical protein [Candidatus Obscuribacter sp.]